MSRFLFATMPIVGHVALIAPVVHELINRGHEVTWYTSAHTPSHLLAADGSHSSPGINRHRRLWSAAGTGTADISAL